MRPQHVRHKRGLLAVIAVNCLSAIALTAESSAAESQTVTPIKHVVIIFGENRSFDNYFATYPFALNQEAALFYPKDDTPTVNGLTGNLLTNNPNLSNPIRLGRADGGLMDKFVQATSAIGTGCATDGSTIMVYYDGNTVAALWNYAQHY